MKKKANMKIAIPVMIGILALVIILKGFGLLTFRSGVRLGFVGNDGIHTFNGSYVKISGTMTHNIRPSKDSTTIHCEITTKSGSLHVLITQKDDDKVILDKEISGDEKFDVTAEGTVKVKISTEEHKGSYKFEY